MPTRPCSVTDNTSAFEAANGGSNPSRGTIEIKRAIPQAIFAHCHERKWLVVEASVLSSLVPARVDFRLTVPHQPE